MKKGCIFSVIFIALLAGCTIKNNNEDITVNSEDIISFVGNMVKDQINIRKII